MRSVRRRFAAAGPSTHDPPHPAPHPAAALLIENNRTQPVGTHADLPCCASAPSCCRWCPEVVCPRLERTSVMVPRLFDTLCADARLTSEATTTEMLNINIAARWLKGK